MRDMVFVSHANPEDNEFARWLSLQLANHGYPVWCDLTRLLGGEDFWKDAEAAIRERTIKFLYVLSRTSNEKDGPLSELQIARNVQRDLALQDFVLPLSVDDLPPRETNIRITNINCVPFQTSWPTGLARVLEKLERDGVPKDARFSPSAVAHWWRSQYRADAGVRQEPESLVSNWFPLASRVKVFFHELSRTGIGPLAVPDNLPYPGFQHEQYLIGLAPAQSFTGHLGPDVTIARSTAWDVGSRRDENPQPPWTTKQERDGLTRLLRQAWEEMLSRRGLPTYKFTNGALAFYFRKEMVPGDEIHVRRPDGTTSTRAILGYKTLKGPGGAPRGLRYWHFALQAKATHLPVPGFIMKTHVLFSDDGRSIWGSKDRLHRARRSQCRSWWNDVWRDRLLGAVQWLSDGTPAIHLPVGDDSVVEVATSPMIVSSPVSYADATVETSSGVELGPEDAYDEDVTDEELGDESETT